MMTRDEEAFRLGYADYRNGRTLQDCPYLRAAYRRSSGRLVIEAQNWLEGWRVARDEVLEALAKETLGVKETYHE